MIMSGNLLKMLVTTKRLLRLIVFTNFLLDSMWNLMKFEDGSIAKVHCPEMARCLTRFEEKRVVAREVGKKEYRWVC